MLPSVNLAGATDSPLLAKLCAAHPGITFTRNGALGAINVIFGQEALDKEFPGHNVSTHHCYVFENNRSIIIPAYALSSQFLEPDRIHWITHAIAKACDIAKRGLAELSAPINYEVEPNLAQVQDYIKKALNSPAPISVDIETIMGSAEITAIAIATSPTSVMSIPFATYGMEPYWTAENEQTVWGEIATLLAAHKPKIFQNFIFDTMCLRHAGFEVNGEINDTLIIANLLNPELPKGLADLGRMYCYCPPWKDKKDFSLQGSPRDFWLYNAQDAARTYEIYQHQLEELIERNLDKFYWVHTQPLIRLVYGASCHGINVNREQLTRLNTKLDAMLTPLAERIVATAQPLMPFCKKVRNKTKDVRGPSPKTGREIVLEKGYDVIQETFNANSAKQIKEILRTLGYAIPKHKGAETTDRRALLKLNRKKEHPFISRLLSYGKLQKLRSTYGSIALDFDGRCRYSFNIGGTKSGRFSCQGTSWGTGLNIQTIPRKNKELAINFREIFIPDALTEGETRMLQVDLSQAELRVVAWLSGEEKLIRMLASGDDVHTYMADEITRQLGKPADRDFGKFLNHASSYGMGAAKLCDMALDKLDLTMSVPEAQAFIDVRKRTFPRVTHWQESVRAEVFRTRRLISPHGRERYFYGIIDDNVIREALSFVPQATVVDCLNDAWIALARNAAYNRDFWVHAQLHDALLVTVKTNKLAHTVMLIDHAFQQQSININGATCLIPWDVTLGASWGTLKPLDRGTV